MIAIIDYGMGNLHSVAKAFEHVGGQITLTSDVSVIARADKIVLPGVGAFADAISALRDKQIVGPLKEGIATGKPFLGICLGMQLLMGMSYEDGEYEGLGVIEGDVLRFDFSGRVEKDTLKIPHMGWNSLEWDTDVPLFKGLTSGSYVYFVHSYYVTPRDETVIATSTNYGIEFASSLWRDNVFGVQYHPEKSQRVGLTMLKNFVEL
ncbi:MAG: imidazole glycerol phosphate synthase subunit HisH [Planctomycetes bacterium]|nr:imidazole glycerol phosphate synthase subunit HisH [Planctomycetota bacterium]